MTINRIESLVFGVADVGECVRFFSDAGLQQTVSETGRAVFETPERQTVVLRPMDDPALPPAVEEGPTLRELVWGVSDQAGVDRLAADLSADRQARVDADGMLHTHDETGFGLGFMVSREEQLPPPTETGHNLLREVHRMNDPVPGCEHPQPLRIVHLALNIPKPGHQEAVDFYLKRLRFRATDVVHPAGTFMQCEGDLEHHNFFLCHRPDKAGVNHFAMEMRGFDELVQAGNYMVDHRWKESRALGRHFLGSNLYRFFHSPAGGRIEFISDMDRMDENFQTRVWEKAPKHHIWSIKSSGVPQDA